MRSFCSVLTMLLLLAGYHSGAFAQGCDLTSRSDIPSVCSAITMTMQHDNLDRPYLYVANKEAGVVVFDVADIEAPAQVSSIPATDLDSLHVMNIHQDGNFLYASLGNHFVTGQESGMAIIDVTDPESPVLKDSWKLDGSVGGGGIVKTAGDYAYLGAMRNGLIILDISDKENVSMVSQYIPELLFPDTPEVNKVNARGMQIRDDIVYLAYDAGGLRILDCTDKSNISEIGRYANPAINGLPRAYNNLEIEDTLLYVTIDYCGLEIISIADPTNPKLMSWWNPWNCPGNNWFRSTGHTNEMAFDRSCRTIFMSTGKSEIYAVDVSDPLTPFVCTSFGDTSNLYGTWGVSRYEDRLYASYICSPGLPFLSLWTLVRSFSYDRSDCATGHIQDFSLTQPLKIYPNPVGDKTWVSLSERPATVTLSDLSGMKARRRLVWLIGTKVSSHGGLNATTGQMTVYPWKRSVITYGIPTRALSN